MLKNKIILNIEEDANNYTLPAAEAGVLGGVKVGSGLSVDSDGIKHKCRKHIIIGVIHLQHLQPTKY